jgi:hypothetical protein
MTQPLDLNRAILLSKICCFPNGSTCAAYAAALHGGNGSAVVGVHLCGDLARRAVELWDTCGVDALVGEM